MLAANIAILRKVGYAHFNLCRNFILLYVTTATDVNGLITGGDKITRG